MKPSIHLPTFSGHAYYMRRWQLNDAKSIFEAVDNNREHLGKWLPWVATTLATEDSKKFIEESVKGFETGTKFEYGIFLGPKYSEETLIGAVGLVNKGENDAEIGYWLSKDFEGNGIITIAVKELITEARNTLKVSSFVIMAMEGNLKSRNIPERLQFVHKGYSDDHIKVNGISYKLIKYQLHF
eukprot:Seg1329.9 transcript_id=Seg1329.9/GoldUCD/mRNA.D3Y31 product="putative ribosomal N-acetyltransferase YdaF" protein_id=Seg1329.9/GoldUCD/D3Y31